MSLDLQDATGSPFCGSDIPDNNASSFCSTGLEKNHDF